MASSYDKIFASFTKSNQWKNLVERFREEIQKSGLKGYEFDSSRDYEENDYNVHTKFTLQLGAIEYKTGSDTLEEATFGFPAIAFLPDDHFNHIVKSLFGTKGYPTYNCKEEKALKFWPEFARARIVRDHADVIEQYMAKVRAHQTILLAGAELTRDKKRYYERLVIDEIRKVVMMYHQKVGPEVLKEALDEVVTHSIMES